MFSQIIHKSLLKYFIFLKRLNFLKTFSSLHKSKNFSHEFLNSKQSFKIKNTPKFQTFFSQNSWNSEFYVLIISNHFKNFLFNHFSHKNWYIWKNILIIFLRNTIFLKKCSKLFPNIFKISQLIIKQFLNSQYKEF